MRMGEKKGERRRRMVNYVRAEAESGSLRNNTAGELSTRNGALSLQEM